MNQIARAFNEGRDAPSRAELAAMRADIAAMRAAVMVALGAWAGRGDGALIVKGTPASGGQRLADHIKRTDTNERMEVKELRGVATEDFEAALLEMEAVGSGSRTKRPFYHASINTQAGERLTDAQRYKAIDRLEEELGLTGQPRAVVVHEERAP